MHIWRVRDACPTSRALPAAISSNAESTAVSSTADPSSSGGGEEALFGIEDPLRGIEVGAGDGIDRRPVHPTQHLGFLDAVVRCGQGNRSMIEYLIDQQVHQCHGMFEHIDRRTCRCASARTCHICHVERLASITDTM